MRPRLQVVEPLAPADERGFDGDDVALVEAFRRGHPAARRELHARYAGHVRRVLYRVLGPDPDLADLHHDVFVRALVSLPKLQDPAALKPWLTSITVHVARSAINRRQRARWLGFRPPEELPELEAETVPPEVREALNATWAVLRAMPTDDRIAFSLRYIDGMELTDVAEACSTSLATIKRRLARAQQRFMTRALRSPVLKDWVEEETR